MTTAVVLRAGVARAVEAVGEADVLVGIPSYNNAGTIGHVVQAAHAGLSKYFPGMRALIVNSDGGSTDGTQDVVTSLHVPSSELLLISHLVRPVRRLTIPYHGIPGKGSAFRCIFEVAQRLRVKACAVVPCSSGSVSGSNPPSLTWSSAGSRRSQGGETAGRGGRHPRRSYVGHASVRDE